MYAIYSHHVPELTLFSFPNPSREFVREKDTPPFQNLKNENPGIADYLQTKVSAHCQVKHCNCQMKSIFDCLKWRPFWVRLNNKKHCYNSKQYNQFLYKTEEEQNR